MATFPAVSSSRPLTERPGFLLSQLGAHSAARFAERMRPLGLRPRHFSLLTHLAAADGQTQQQLADALDIHRNTMVGLVDELEHRGLVERRDHPSDRRAHALHLTTAARELLARAERAADDHDADLLVGLDERDARRLIGLLQQVVEDADLRPGVHPRLREPARSR